MKSYDKKDKILIVGGAGFIGSCVAQRLVADGYSNIFIFDNFSTGSTKSIPYQCKVIKGDLRSREDLEQLPKDITYVFHLAAATSVDESFLRPDFYIENNVMGTIHLLDWMKKNRIKKIIYSSSSAVYGDVDEYVTMKEDLNPSPINIYALTKLDGEHVVHMYHINFGIEYAILRYFNVFGEGQECTSDHASVIPKFIYAALQGKDITVYGSGKQTRDFIHVLEVADACILAMENGNGIYNVASGEQHDINTVAKLILKNIRTNSKIIHLSPVPGDAMRDSGCNKRITKLGWSRKSSFEVWLKKTIQWYMKNNQKENNGKINT